MTKIIDCTLRDGGYYNEWEFEPELVRDYLTAVGSSGITHIELGLRSFRRQGFHGPFAYTTDRFIETLEIPPNVTLGVMVDAKTILGAETDTKTAVQALFAPAGRSSVQLVRIAAHFGELEESKDIATCLKNLGYTVGLNLMQASIRSADEISQAVTKIATWGVVDVLYFADSLGNMQSEQIREMVKLFRESWPHDLGIHAHNNMGQANENTLLALDLGCNWLDATMLGMGRGAGNCQSEILLTELNRRLGRRYETDSVYALVIDHFLGLQAKLGWGPNFVYHFCALNKIHPTYAQELLSDTKYSSRQKLDILKRLKEKESTAFSSDQLVVENQLSDTPNGKWDATGWCKDKPVLILGGGDSLAQYREAISEFVRSQATLTVSLNYHDEIPQELIWAYISCSAERLEFEVDLYQRVSGARIIAPYSMLEPGLAKRFGRQNEALDYGVNVAPDVSIGPSGATITTALSLPYAIAIAIAGGASKIYLAGFDGYTESDASKNVPLIDALTAITTKYPTEIVSLTRTLLPIEQSSIFAY